MVWIDRSASDRTGKHVCRNCNDTEEFNGIYDRSGSQDNIVKHNSTLVDVLVELKDRSTIDNTINLQDKDEEYGEAEAESGSHKSETTIPSEGQTRQKKQTRK
jgi:hypothetical protein